MVCKKTVELTEEQKAMIEPEYKRWDYARRAFTQAMEEVGHREVVMWKIIHCEIPTATKIHAPPDGPWSVEVEEKELED